MGFLAGAGKIKSGARRGGATSKRATLISCPVYYATTKSVCITTVLFCVSAEVYPGLSLPFFHKLAFVSLFLLSFVSFQETLRPTLPIQFHHLISCGLVRDYHQVRQSCEVLCRRREQQPFLRGFFLALPCPVGIEKKVVRCNS